MTSPPSDPLSIRPATADDAALILAFIRELATYEKLLHEVEATEEGLRRTLFPADGRRPVAHVLIGEWAGRPEGFAVYFHNYSTFLGKEGLYLEDVFVRPAARGRGIGKAILLHLARLAVAQGLGRVDWSVLDWNEPAIAFYRSLGAVPMADWTLFRLTGTALQEFGRP
jgi:GNAT superfamily N-acetyltransferase